MRQRKLFIDGFHMNVATAGSGRPVLFIHGLGWDHMLWSRQLASLSSRYAVVAADTRGHGASDKPAGPYSIARFADDYAGMLDCLQTGPVCVVGFSQGGLVAQMLALERPDLVGALVLAGTACRGAAAGQSNMAARQQALDTQGPREAARIAAHGVFSERWSASHAGDIEAFIERRLEADIDALKASMQAGRGVDMSERLSSIGVPTLVIGARLDRMMPPDLGREIAARIRGATFELIEDAGHMFPVEQPEVFDALVDGFLAKHWAPREAFGNSSGNNVLEGAKA